MAVPRITQDAVNEIADRLVQAGEHPSVAAVRVELGSGSYTTITKYLQVWREQQEQVAAVELPGVVEAAYRKAAAAAWTEATRLASVEVSNLKNDMAQERIRYAREVQEASAEIVKLEELVEALRQDKKKLVGELDETRTDLGRINRELITASAQRESALKEKHQLEAKVSSLETENRELIKQVGSLEGQLKTGKSPARPRTKKSPQQASLVDDAHLDE